MIFLRLPDSQVAHGQDIVRPPESHRLDYEAEIAVIIGQGGADFGMRGYVSAWDQATGKQVWKFYVVPGSAEANKILAGKGESAGFKSVFNGKDFTGWTAAGGGGRAGGRVAKGMRMAGRMGGDRVTVKGLKIVQVDAAKNIILVGGPVPGRRGTLVEIREA